MHAYSYGALLLPRRADLNTGFASTRETSKGDDISISI